VAAATLVTKLQPIDSQQQVTKSGRETWVVKIEKFDTEHHKITE